MSSKFEISVKMPSGPDSCEDERKDEDLDDLEPDSSGGEFGVVVQMVVISSNLLWLNQKVQKIVSIGIEKE